MADEKKIQKPGMPPLPPGMMKPGLPPMLGGKPSLPPMGQPSFGAMPSPGMPQPSFAPQFSQPQQPAQPAAPARDLAAEAEAKRLEEEKEKLERKISDMEKMLSAEKEKALLATLKNQQDEALSSRVEPSLKDSQDKMRRDRRDHEVEEERLTLKSKIKELETRLAGERETWMQTLKEQMSEREVQGRDVEGHFIYRLQEMERRWLDEKAQWQKEISVREDMIRSLKSSAERLREVEDEFRKTSLEKSMLEREAAKLKDEVARAEREKASIESYIKIIPDKEREIADLRAENAVLRGRDGQSVTEAKLREEKHNFELDKLQKEIGRLQADIGSISDRKNNEKNEEIKLFQARYEMQLQEKEKIIADVSGEKVRAVSELVKIKGFISRVQAINAVLDKERGQLKLEKMQLAQNMAAQLEEIKRLKQELDGIKAAHQGELEAQAVVMKAEITRIKNGYGAELAHKHAEELAEAARVHQEELARLATAHQIELSSAVTSHQADVSRLNGIRQDEAARTAAAHQAELSKLTGDYQAELSKITAGYQAEIGKIAAAREADAEERVSQLRMKIESGAEAEKEAIRKQLTAEYEAKLKEARDSGASAGDVVLKLEMENRRLSAVAADFDRTMAARIREYDERLARAEADLKRQDEALKTASAQKAEAENAAREAGKYARESAGEYQKISAEYAAIREQFSVLSAQKAAADAELAKLSASLKSQEENLRMESENRARFESELLFLKQKIQQMELQSQETAVVLEAERAAAEQAQAVAAEQQAGAEARIMEASAELARYKALEASFSDRLKWAIKGPGKGQE